MPILPPDTDQIVITASRVPEAEAQTAASVTIIDQQQIERLDEPLISSFLRLTPSVVEGNRQRLEFVGRHGDTHFGRGRRDQRYLRRH